MSSFGVYQDESENADLYQEMNISWGWYQNQKNYLTCSARYSCNNQHVKKLPWCILDRCLGVLSFIKTLWRYVCPKLGF